MADDSKTESPNQDFAGHDAKPVERKVTPVRQWEHDGDPNCGRKDKPVFTPLDELPKPCGVTTKGRDWYACGKDSWRSKGIVLRDQDKRVVGKERD